MNHYPSDDDLRQAYKMVDRDHERLRQELLAALPETPPPSGLTESIASVRWRTLGKRGVALAVGMAACVAFAVIAGLVLVGNQSAHGYTIADVPKQLLTLRSIHVKGWLYNPRQGDAAESTERYPIEWFAERPHRYCITRHAFSPGKVIDFFEASDGDQSIHVDHERKFASLGIANAFAVELRVETILQGGLVALLLQSPTTSYKQIAVESINGVKTLVYELVMRPEGAPGLRNVVWLNPRTGLPVKSALYSLDGSGAEKVKMLLDAIEVNTSPPAHLFTFRAPDDYKVVKILASPGVNELFNLGSAAVPTHQLRGLFAFNIEDRAVLLCWSYTNSVSPPLSGQELAKLLPSVILGSGVQSRRCNHQLLRGDPGKGEIFGWSLAAPEDGKAIGEEGADLVMTIPKMGQMTVSTYPLRFSRERLATVIAHAQQVTAPRDLPGDDVISLDRLQKLLRQ